MNISGAVRTDTRRVAFALGYQTWADGAARGHSWSPNQMVQRLCADPSVAEVVVADPARHPWRLWQARREDGLADLAGTGRRATLVRPWRLGKGEPSGRSGALRVQRRVEEQLRNTVEASQTVLVTCHPLLAGVASRRSWSDVVYYGWDDWASYAPLGRGRHLVEEAYEAMAARDVHVVGVTRAIVERIGAPRGTVVPNGVAGHELTGDHPVPPWFAALGGPVAFYAGSLEERIDVDSLGALARTLPDLWVVLVGPMLRPDWFAPLSALPNVVIRGVQARPDVLAMARAASVCLVPHRDTTLTRAMSPLKLYEYLGAGSPVVATDLEPMRGISERCLLVPAGCALADAVRRATQMPAATTEELADFRQRHDWSARYEVWREAVLGR